MNKRIALCARPACPFIGRMASDNLNVVTRFLG